MSFNITLAGRIRSYLLEFPGLETAEKKMFRGMTFMVNGKMCVGVSAENLMCRFDPELQKDAAVKSGFMPMIMEGKVLRGYCYVEPEGLRDEKDLAFWLNLCLAFNDRAVSSKVRRPVRR